MADAFPKLTIAVSSRALFDAEADHELFLRDGPEAFVAAENERTLAAMRAGAAIEIIRKIHDWSDRLDTSEILLVSRRDPNSGARVLRSLADQGVTRVMGCFTSGGPVVPYLKAYGADLFLTRDAQDAQAAVNAGIAAAHLLGVPAAGKNDELRVAFDGDAVLFNDEAERFFVDNGLEAFQGRELDRRDLPLGAGPLADFAKALATFQSAAGRRLVRTALVTARQGRASERALRSLAALGITVDESHFCGSTPKVHVLEAFGADLFFDDSARHITLASERLPSGHVPWRSPTEIEEEGPDQAIGPRP